jgi:hypothetical protein
MGGTYIWHLLAKKSISASLFGIKAAKLLGRIFSSCVKEFCDLFYKEGGGSSMCMPSSI